jgi:hypothetical protein
MSKLASLLAVGLIVVFAGCGGGDKSGSGSSGGSDKTQVEASFRTYLDKLAAKDGAGACDAMAPSLQQKMLAAMEKAGAGALVKGKSCGDVLDFIAEQSASYNKAASALKDAKIANVKITGDKATYDWTLTVSGQTVNNKGEATKIDGKWLVSCCVPGQ